VPPLSLSMLMVGLPGENTLRLKVPSLAVRTCPLTVMRIG
jgi:hypothetical protein